MGRLRSQHNITQDRKAKAHTRRRTIDDTEQRLVHTRQPRHRHMQCACKLAYGCSAIVAGSLHHANVSAHAEQSSRAGQYHAADRRVTFTLSRSLRQSLNRSEEHTSELQSLMRISYAVFCLKKTKKK